ncbi:MAG: FdhB6 [Candidatus Magnetoglobus multicellularis str. Araruama]|uniref:FdhB6 n=1 Tax=Candidatus Magnetoglobus multicellularis str. Araruama TaxID=890399 RepID=A0A1V1PDU6_9BACT|nr:MAG: FdhB6 [Candidatus Magnetoglobus multicellularis str. Araruama]
MDDIKWLQGKRKPGIKAFFQDILTKGLIDTVLMPAKNKKGNSYAWFLMNKDGFLETSDPIPPVMTIQGANILKNITKKGESWSKTAVVLRPCELRAVIELTKLEQINLENIILISFDCPGAYPLTEYISGDQTSLDQQYDSSLYTASFETERNACIMCDKFTGQGADIQLCFLGQSDDGFLISAASAKGKELLKDVNGTNEENLEIKTKKRDELLGQLQREKTKNDRLFWIDSKKQFMARIIY